MIKDLHNKKEFDDYFKKKYAEDTIEPSQDLWENINKNIKYKGISANYRNILKLKIAVITLSVALIGSITYFEFLINNTKQIKTENTLNSINTDLKNKSGKTKTNKNQFGIKMTDSSNTNKQIPVNTNRNMENSSGNKNIFKEPENFSSQNISANKNSIKLQNHKKIVIVNSKNEDSTSSENIVNSINNNQVSDFQDTVNNAIDSQNNIIGNKVISDNRIDIVAGNDKDLLKNTVNKNTQKNDLNTENNTVDTISENLPVESRLFSEEKNSVYKGDSILNRQSKRNDGFSIKKNIKDKFSFGINFTPQYSYRYLLNNTDYYIPDIGISYFNSHEKGNFSFASGLNLLYQISNKWKIATGIEYSQYSQKTELQNFELKKDAQTGYYIYTSVGRNNLSINSSVLPNNANFLKSSILYSFVNIPLSAEYKLSKNIFINAGINYGFLFNEDVNWKAEDYEGDFFINTNSITGFKTSNLSFSAGFGYEQTIYKKISIIINPQITSFVTSLTNQMPVNTYPYILGIKLGLRYK